MKILICSVIAFVLIFGVPLMTVEDNGSNSSSVEHIIEDKLDLSIINLSIVDVASDSVKIVSVETEDTSVSTVGDLVLKELGVSEKCIKKVFLENDVVIVDFTEDSIVLHSGTSGEMAILDSLAKTFVENLKYKNIIFRVNGSNYESGHIVFGFDEKYY